MTDFDPTTYGASIADEYDDLYGDELDTGGAVDRLEELAEGGPVLELGVGTGRVALPLAARGIEVHGVEASEQMLAVLRSKPGGDAIPVAQGNFSEVRAGAGFALVALVFNTIFALPDQEAQVRTFANAASHLRPGGRFVVEAWVPDVAAFRHGRALRPRLAGPDRISVEVATLDPVAQVMRTTQAVLAEGDVRLHPATHRYAWPAELDLMARLAGMELEARWSDWRRSPFTAASRDHVSVYRLRPR